MSLSKPLKDFEAQKDTFKQSSISTSKEQKTMPGAVYKKNANLVPERKISTIKRKADFKARSKLGNKNIIVYRYSKAPSNREPEPEMILSPDCVNVHARGIPIKSVRPPEEDSNTKLVIESTLNALKSSVQKLNLQSSIESTQTAALSGVSCDNWISPATESQANLESAYIPLAASLPLSLEPPPPPQPPTPPPTPPPPPPPPPAIFAQSFVTSTPIEKPHKIWENTENYIGDLDNPIGNCSASTHCSICSATKGMPSLFSLAPHCMYKEPGVTIFDSLNDINLQDDDKEQFDSCNVVFGDFTNFDEFLTTERKRQTPKSNENRSENQAQRNSKQKKSKKSRTGKAKLKKQNDSTEFFEQFIPKLSVNREKDEDLIKSYNEYIQAKVMPSHEPVAAIRQYPQQLLEHSYSKLDDSFESSEVDAGVSKPKKSISKRKQRAFERKQAKEKSHFNYSQNFSESDASPLEQSSEYYSSVSSVSSELNQLPNNQMLTDQTNINLPESINAACHGAVPKTVISKSSKKSHKKRSSKKVKVIEQNIEENLDDNLNKNSDTSDSSLDSALDTLLKAIEGDKESPKESQTEKNFCFKQPLPVKAKVSKLMKAKVETKKLFGRNPVGTQDKELFDFEVLQDFKTPNENFLRRLQAQINFIRLLNLSEYQRDTLKEIERSLLKGKTKKLKKSSDQKIYENYYFTKVRSDPAQRLIIDRYISGGWNGVKRELQLICGKRAQKSPMKMVEEFIVDCKKFNNCDDIGYDTTLPKWAKQLKDAEEKSDLAEPQDYEEDDEL